MNFKEQARASIEQLDADQIEAAEKRVDAILGSQAGPTLIPQQETQPQAPDDVEWASECEVCHKPIVRRGRNRLSNCGHMRMSGGGWVAKDAKPKAPTDSDEIVLHLTLAEARNAAIACGKFDCHGIADHIQDQIIQQLQRRIDQLQKQK